MSSRVDTWNSAVDSGLSVVRHTVTATMDAFEECVGALAIPGADAAVAIMASQNMVRVLHMPLSVAIIVGIALEGVGLVTSRAALRCRFYNQTHRNEPPAMEWMAWTVAVVQFAIGLALVCVNAVWLDAMVFGLIAIGTLSATGTLAHMIENDVKAREVNATAATPAAIVAPEPPADSDVADTPEQPVSAKDRVMWAYRENPHADKRDVAKALGIGYSTVSKAYRELAAEGAIGNGRH